MLKPFQRTIAGLLVSMAGAAFVSILAIAARARQAAGPQDVARGFYSWYLHELSREKLESTSAEDDRVEVPDAAPLCKRAQTDPAHGRRHLHLCAGLGPGLGEKL